MAGTNVEVAKIRHLRHRKFEGLTRGAEGATQDVARLKRLQTWLDDRATDLNGTGAGQTFTADFTNDEIDITSHGRATADGPFVVSTTTTLPAGLVAGTLYWVNAVTANALSLHLTREEAAKGINAVDMTDAGTGTHTLTPADTSTALVEVMRTGTTSERVEAVADIDDLI